MAGGGEALGLGRPPVPGRHRQLSERIGGRDRELAYTTDIETFNAQIDGVEQPVAWSNRVTHIFRLERGAWRLVHRHANRLEARSEPSTRIPHRTA
jgi:hypothetical protein